MMQDHQSIVGPGTGWRVVCLVLLASAWGLSELVGGDTLWLTARAVFLLAAARALVNRPGSSTALAAVAVLFKSVNTAPYLCHLVGIALLGIAFDIAATLLWRKDRRPLLRAGVTGAGSAFLSASLFAATMVWILRYKSWADGGLSRVGEHTFYSGGRGALIALIAAPIGLWLGSLLARQATGHPRTVFYTATAVCLAVWVVGPFAD
jgi:hypothetical protein